MPNVTNDNDPPLDPADTPAGADAPAPAGADAPAEPRDDAAPAVDPLALGTFEEAHVVIADEISDPVKAVLAMEAVAAESADASGEADESASHTRSDGAPSFEMSSQAAATADAAPQADDGPATSPEAVAQIDEYLANQADDAVAGDFETVHEVLAVEQAIASGMPDPVLLEGEAASSPPEPEPAASVVGLNELDAAAETEHAGGPDAETDTDPAFATDIAADDPVHDNLADIHAAFTSPDDLMPAAFDTDTPGPEDVCGAADAAAIGRTDHHERDPLAGLASAGPNRDAWPDGASSSARGALWRRWPAALGNAARIGADALYRCCAVVNRPLQNAGPDTRRLVGYAALLTVGNASLLLLVKLVGSMLG